MEEKIEQWVGDYVSGNLSEEEKHKLQEWLQQSNHNKDRFVKLLNRIRAHREYDVYEKTSLESYKNVKLKISRRHKIKGSLRISTAASILLILGSIFFVLNTGNKEQQQFAYTQINPGERKAFLQLPEGRIVTLDNEMSVENLVINNGLLALNEQGELSYDYSEIETEQEELHTIKVPIGGEYNFILSDGTRVWLNSDSELSFPAKFIGNNRKVIISGEAYFDVKKSDKPFIVIANDSEIEVLGTRFNVSAYPENNFILTTLESGSVDVKFNSQNILLEPGVQSIINKEEKSITKKEVETSLYTSWIKGIFEYENMRLEDILWQLSKWYDLTYEFRQPELLEKRFTGVVIKYKNLNNALENIEKTTNVRFILNNRHITVTSLI